MNVLIAVASKHGATAEIGAVIADEPVDCGLEVAQAAPDEVDDLSPFAAVVHGSAVCAGHGE